MLNPAKRQRLRDLSRRAWLRVIGRVFGVDALSPDERAEVGAVAGGSDVVVQAYSLGAGTDELGDEEELRVQAARDRAGDLIRGIAERTADRYEEVFDLQDLRDTTAGAVEDHDVPKTLAADLRRASQSLERDWDRVATTELQGAYNEGRAQAIRVQHGDADDPEVYKEPAPDACRWCVSLHIGPDGHPRIYRLSTLEAHGDNAGRRKSEWRAVVGPVHPHCTCALHYVAPGWGFDEDGDLVPGGAFGVRYADEGAIHKALDAEATIQKAARVGGRLDFQGLPIQVEANAGDVRKWRAPGGREGRTVLRFAYGEIVGTHGADGEPVDVYLGPDPTASFAFAVDQRRPDGTFDEQKLFLGFRSPNDVEAAYKAHYPEQFWGGVLQLSMDELRTKLAAPDPDGVLKGEGTGVLRLAGRSHDDRGWHPRSSGATAAGTPPNPRAARPGRFAVALEEYDADRRAKQKSRVVAVVPIDVGAKGRRLYDEPKRRDVTDERRDEIRRHGGQLDARMEERRRHARPDPSAARVGSVLPSIDNDVGSS